MKKILAVLVAIVMLASTFTMVAGAYTLSPEVNGIISGINAKDDNGKVVEIFFFKIDGKVVKEFTTSLDNLKKETGNDDLKVVAQYDNKISDNVKYPIRITLDVLGVSDTSTAYVLVYTAEGQTKAIEATVSNGKITFDATEKFVKVSIVVDKKTADKVEKENNITSPQTQDYTKVAVFALFASLLATVIVYKKVKA